MSADLKMSEYRAVFIPQESIRCEHCAEKGISKGKAYTNEEFWTTQTPVAVVIRFSDESIIFRNVDFQRVIPLVETKCSTCGKLNLYPLNYWSEDAIKRREKP